MVAAYVKEKEEAMFHAAFEAKLTALRTEPKTYEPQVPLTPWYLDPESGGPNPAVKKPGISYQQGTNEFS
jgi:hypothetical protein